VLVVEDEPDLLLVLRTALRFSAHLDLVGEAPDAMTAESLAAEHRPDAIVLALYHPDVTGRKTLRRVRAASPRSRIVVFSAHESQRWWHERRAIGFVRKDEGIERLMHLLETTPRIIDE
jgi:DNA-binding NarL/FixJ family response regulator